MQPHERITAAIGAANDAGERLLPVYPAVPGAEVAILHVLVGDSRPFGQGARAVQLEICGLEPTLQPSQARRSR